MSGMEEMKELHEAAEEGHHKNLAVVSLTMAIVAVLVAISGLLGHRAHTEEVVLQNKVTDQWAYYQAKNIRRSADEHFLDYMAIYPPANKEAAEKIAKKNEAEIDKYRDQQKEIDAEARKLTDETELIRRRADRFDLGESLLEVALVICSLTLLTGRRPFWIAGMVVALVGVAASASAFLLH